MGRFFAICAKTICASLWLFAATPGVGQAAPAPATLVADSITVLPSGVIQATGNVEIFYDGIQLRATALRYDRAADRLVIEGPMRLVDGDQTTLLADSAELDGQLRDGILRGARLVLNQQLQMAAAQINRVQGRYTQLYKTTASSCEVCPENPVPLWEIRARKITHDQHERQLYFDNATLRFMDIPVFYVPRLRLPDPTLERATGFLIPSFESDSNLGVGLKAPYFITLGDHRDLTLTPLITTRTKTLGLRYRQAWRRGDIDLSGALSRDDLLPGQTRGYIFAEGAFELGRGFGLGFDVKSVSDRSYLLSYGITDTDQLGSEITLSRIERDELIFAGVSHNRSLRAGDDNSILPNLAFDATYHRRFVPGALGGVAEAVFGLHAHRRTSATDGLDGRDVARASFDVNWRRDMAFGNGMRLGVMAAYGIDFYDISQDMAFVASQTTTTPQLGVELRWPWQKAQQNGTRHVFEPIVQALWSPTTAATVPNEDSLVPEFDAGNLFSDSRFPGADRNERGLRANLGLRYTRYGAKGWNIGVTVGRTYRERVDTEFGVGSGLEGQNTHWMTAINVELPGRFSVMNRSLLDDQLSFAKSETRLDWNSDRLALGSTYVWLAPEPLADRLVETAEWQLDASYRINDNWTGAMDMRYDFDTGQATAAKVGLSYANECLTVDLGLSRRYTSSLSVKPTTKFGVTISLGGFGARNTPKSAHQPGQGLAAKRCLRHY